MLNKIKAFFMTVKDVTVEGTKYLVAKAKELATKVKESLTEEVVEVIEDDETTTKSKVKVALGKVSEILKNAYAVVIGSLVKADSFLTTNVIIAKVFVAFLAYVIVCTFPVLLIYVVLTVVVYNFIMKMAAKLA